MNWPNELGTRRWAIPEGYVPVGRLDPDDPALPSHETYCLLNQMGDDADIAIAIFSEDREPAGPYRFRLTSRHTLLRFNDLKDPEPVPFDTACASLIESTVPIIMQRTRP